MAGLFGDDFEINIKKPNIKELIAKVEKPAAEKEISAEKALKSKKTTLEEKLNIITTNVYSVLGKQREHVVVIRDIDTFKSYIDKAIEKGRIAIDTETNNSLDPITCKIMGLCLYVPDEKQAYIPINHIDNETGLKLENQLTEEDCKNQLQRLIDNNVFTVFHNYKFDYQVIKCTCGIEVPCNWDTMIVAKLIDENEKAGLKQQYIEKIDLNQEKYSIDHLFENVLYEQVDPSIFALYAATDSMMTDKLYLWQKPIMESYEKENPERNPYKLFREVELPCIQVMAEMELAGVAFDVDYANRLRTKFTNKLAVVDKKIEEELVKLNSQINDWRLSADANYKAIKKGKSVEINGITYRGKSNPEQLTNTWFKVLPNSNDEVAISNEEVISLKLNAPDLYGKSKAEQLDTKINLKSPTQLAILFYDILKVPVVDKNTPRGTGEEILKALQKEYPICQYLLERRSIDKMLDAFINSLPEEINPKTGKIHCDFNQYGAATGRTSCSGPNLQQIPSHEKSIRLLFMADCPGHQVELTNNYYDVPETDEVETVNGWKKVADIVNGDKVIGQENIDIIKSVEKINTVYRLYV